MITIWQSFIKERVVWCSISIKESITHQTFYSFYLQTFALLTFKMQKHYEKEAPNCAMVKIHFDLLNIHHGDNIIMMRTK